VAMYPVLLCLHYAGMICYIVSFNILMLKTLRNGFPTKQLKNEYEIT